MFSPQQESSGIFKKMQLSYYHSKVMHFTANKQGKVADDYLKRMEEIGPLSVFHIAFGVRAAILAGNKRRARELLALERIGNRLSDIDRQYLELSLKQAASVVTGDSFVTSTAEQALMRDRRVDEKLRKFLPIPTAA